MYILAYTVLLALSPLQQEVGRGACDGLYHETDALYRDLALEAVKPPESLQHLADLAQETRLCYGDAHRERVMDLYYDEVYALSTLRRYQEAFRTLDSFFVQFAGDVDSVWFPVMYAFSGHLYEQVGALSSAIAAYGHALSYAPADQPDRQAHLFFSAGLVFQRMKDFRSAQSYYERALQLLRAPPAPGRRAFHLNQLARVLQEQANMVLEQAASNPAAYAAALAGASAQLRESIALDRRTASGRTMVFSLLALGESLSYRDSLDAAYHHMEQALALAAELQDPELQGFAHYKIGRLYMQQRYYQDAGTAFRKALSLAETAKNDDHRRRILTHLGVLSELQNDYVQAEEAYRAAIAITEASRAGLGATQWSALAFSLWQEPYRGLVRVLLAAQRIPEAFDVLESTRARHLHDVRLQARLLADSAFAQRSQLDDLDATLQDVRNRLGALPDAHPARPDLLAAEARLAAALDTLLSVPDGLSLPSLERLQERLALRGQALISFFIDEADALFGRAARSYAFLLTSDSLVAIPLTANTASIRSTLAGVSPLLSFEEGPAIGLGALQFSNASLKRLYDATIGPMASRLPSGTPLILIPDGPLFLVPFAALLTADTPAFRYRDAPFLIRRHPLSVELAASLLVSSRGEEPAPAYDVVAFGKTHFADVRLPDVYYAPGLSPAGTPLPDLPAVAEELAVIKNLFAKVSVAQDEAATEQAFLERLGAARVIHVASHTLVNPVSPLQSALILSPGGTENDGILHLYELEHHDLNAQLVVLSGCNTARGLLLSGEGMAGLQYAFRSMGVESTLATLWLVEDDASARLMTLFYRNVRDGMPKDVALQQAQLDFLESAPEADASPFYWAAAVLYGSVAPLSLQPRSCLTLPWVWLATGLFVLGGSSLLFYFRRAHLPRHRPS